MTDLELVEQHLTQDLEQRREGGDDCPKCHGLGIWSFTPHELCRDCSGSGRSPYITAAEEALAAVQRVRAGVATVREEKVEQNKSEWTAALAWALRRIDTSAPLTTEERKQA